MYRPTAFQEDNVDKLVAFMRANSFATLVSIVEGVPYASHVPLVVKVQGDVIQLIGHLAKPNPQWQAFETVESLAIFTGAHAYISPALYEKHENVPTWNYIAVHAYGIPKVITLNHSPESMDQMIDEMIDTYEADYKSHWHGLSDGYRQGMMNGIIGFEMTVTRLEGKYKLSQNRSQTDQETVSAALLQSSDPVISAVGEEIRQNLSMDD
ncbi:FMN-binding negative transcriptional regulator [Leptolyngbya sp. FACHB-541]|uniref:FMN-binding negative transcriptional regulator n=1 Tax=Leptolyngbya sp. FACHB-541 TaxID=2692810 RepID=UPI001687E909|nr:FMN-binding negative transcriptional regulator [Leptolyngbya sp. FACHB-541]MBD1997556.1 FMN-binding negative transcriptional regulator [Leptolyngbya sp. FACHB-541]